MTTSKFQKLGVYAIYFLFLAIGISASRIPPRAGTVNVHSHLVAHQRLTIFSSQPTLNNFDPYSTPKMCPRL
jgi:hypothetical protein